MPREESDSKFTHCVALHRSIRLESPASCPVKWALEWQVSEHSFLGREPSGSGLLTVSICRKAGTLTAPSRNLPPRRGLSSREGHLFFLVLCPRPMMRSSAVPRLPCAQSPNFLPLPIGRGLVRVSTCVSLSPFPRGRRAESHWTGQDSQSSPSKDPQSSQVNRQGRGISRPAPNTANPRAPPEDHGPGWHLLDMCGSMAFLWNLLTQLKMTSS